MCSKNQNLAFNTILASILLALFVDAKTLNLIVVAACPSFAGVFMTVMYAVLVLGIFVVGLFLQKRNFSKLKASHLGICVLCTLWYFMTSTFIAPPSVNIQFFGIFMLAAFLIPGILCIDVRTFLMALVIFPFMGVLYLDRIFFSDIIETGVVSMGTCYALLVPVLGNLVYLRFYYRKESVRIKVLMIFFAAINLFYLLQMAMFGSRGPILCALLLIISFFIVKIDDNGKISMRKGRILIIIVAIIFLMLSFTAILQVLKDFLATFDITLNVIDKFLRLEDTGDMTNGREVLSTMAWKGIMESPVLGNGISQFDKNTGEGYPHNFILQMLYDGGIILTSCIMIPIIRTLIQKMRTISESEFICLLLFLFASVPGALFSGDLWNAGTLWLFFGFVLSRNAFINSRK